MEQKNKENQPSTGKNDQDQDEVSRRAYELYQARGAEAGHDLEDWLQAEEEINRQGQVAYRD